MNDVEKADWAGFFTFVFGETAKDSEKEANAPTPTGTPHQTALILPQNNHIIAEKLALIQAEQEGDGNVKKITLL